MRIREEVLRLIKEGETVASDTSSIQPIGYARRSGPAVCGSQASTSERGGSTGRRFWLLFRGPSSFLDSGSKFPTNKGRADHWSNCELNGTSHPTGLEQSVLDFELGFEFSNALPQRLNGSFDFGGGIARRDVFRTVPIERDDLNEEQSLE